MVSVSHTTIASGPVVSFVVRSPMKKLMVFDLDGTLAVSKSPLDVEMVHLLDELLKLTQVAVISGGDWPQFQKQILEQGIDQSGLEDLYLLPTCGTKFYRYLAKWQEVYAANLSDSEKERIIDALKSSMLAFNIAPKQVWGEVIEDRGSQITFSALGQSAPISAKQGWDPDFVTRKMMQKFLLDLIPEFSVRIGGTTSIDVTRPGIDKAFGIAKLAEILEIDKEEMLFVGDAIFPGGNDYAVKEAGVTSIQVRDPNETKRVIEAVIAWASL